VTGRGFTGLLPLPGVVPIPLSGLGSHGWTPLPLLLHLPGSPLQRRFLRSHSIREGALVQRDCLLPPHRDRSRQRMPPLFRRLCQEERWIGHGERANDLAIQPPAIRRLPHPCDPPSRRRKRPVEPGKSSFSVTRMILRMNLQHPPRRSDAFRRHHTRSVSPKFCVRRPEHWGTRTGPRARGRRPCMHL
jgi:hypothetical protein